MKRLVFSLVVALSLVGCGGSSDSDQSALADDVKAKDIGSCLSGEGWTDMATAVSPRPGAGLSHLSTTIDSPSDGTTVVLTDGRLPAPEPAGIGDSFTITGKYAWIEVTVAGLSITDDEKAQIYDCAAG